jgi:hypothetical protein
VKTVLAFSLTLLTLIITVSLSVRREHAINAPVYKLPVELNDKLPHHSYCEERSTDEVIDCFIPGIRGLLIGKNVSTKRVTDIRYFVYQDNVTAGAFVLQWGTPRGYLRQRYGTFVFWSDNRAVYFPHETKPFGPTLRAGFLWFSTTAQPSCAWAGFTNSRKGC